MKKKLHQYEIMCIALLFAVFGIVAWRVHAGGVTVMDTYVRGLVKGYKRRVPLHFLVLYKIGISNWDSRYARYKFACFWKKRYYATMIVYPLGILITHLVNKGIKEIVQRERPSLNEALDALGYSFPSGHAMLSIMTFGFLAYIIAANLKSIAGKCVTTILMGTVILSIGLSRVILNVHYPTDILAGYCVGCILLVIAIYYHRLLTERLGFNKER